MKKLFLLLSASLICYPVFSQSKTLYVGAGEQYPTLQTAAQNASPGDAIMVRNGTYTTRENIINLNGEPEKPIIIFAEEEGKVIYSGQSEAWHLTSCSHLFIYGFTFEKQTGNGVNIDDGGSNYGSAHNIIIKNCVFRDMNATGNNDLLKLSGLDDFTIEKCQFINGSPGGSGIDMVGCHRGIIENNSFENMGSNSIQMKGGSQFISIHRNKFINGGQRALNIGGSTGLDFFRPKDAKFESADIDVYSNIFVGSWAPIAFVGTIRSRVFNNTIYKPHNWVFRILQESVDPDRFFPCGQNEFSNNIIYFGNSLSRVVNVGPNTNPQSFTLSNNLWYNYENNNFDGPELPVIEQYPIIQTDPMFADAENMNFEILSGSPALYSGKKFNDVLDFRLRFYSELPCIGAFQSNGIYKDFTGDISTSWIYDHNFKSGYQSLIVRDKVIEGDKEICLITLAVRGQGVIEIDYKFFTSDDKFYYKKTYFDGQDHPNDTFHLLYDYSLKTGDVVDITDPYGSAYGCSIKLDSVRFQFIAGKVRKILEGYCSTLEFNDHDTVLNCGQPGKLIEGIHSVNSFMFGNPTIKYNSHYDDSNAFNLLRCFVYGDENNGFTTAQFTDHGCFHTSSTSLPGHNTVTVFPNPAGNELNFILDHSFTGNIDIYDLTGKKLISKKIISQDHCSINIIQLKNGAYIARIYDVDINILRKFTVLGKN